MSPDENDALTDPSATVKTRSCHGCAEKKIKCDRREPCLHCKKQRTQCVFPPPGRARRKMKYASGAHKKDLQRRLELMEEALREMRNRNLQQNPNSQIPNEEDVAPPPEKSMPTPEPDPDLVENPGTLITDAGQSRYVSNDSALWATILEEIDDLKVLVVSEPCDNEPRDTPSPFVQHPTKHQGFMFNFSSLAIDMRSFHPPTSHIDTYWQIYISNVDPLIKIMHTPSFITHIFTAKHDSSLLSKPVEAAIFSIYHSVIVSMTPKEVHECFMEERAELLSKYRFATEQALARANFLSTRNLMTLQAFAQFLLAAPHENDHGLARNLTGNLIRSAQSIGLHRDVSGSGISPFETEMRRRLWWNIRALDCRASEDFGIEPMITGDTVALPSNLNDADLHPSMTRTPPPWTGATDITLCLSKFTMARMSAQVRSVGFQKSSSGEDGSVSHLNATAAAINETQDEILAQLEVGFNHPPKSPHSQPQCELSGRTFMRLMSNTTLLHIYHPLRLAEIGVILSMETRTLLFQKAIDILECSRILETSPSIAKWAWQSRSYVQWHAIALILAGLCCPHNTECPDGTEISFRAWTVLVGVFQDWGNDPYEQRTGQLWLPMRKLRDRVRIMWEERYGRTVDDFLRSMNDTAGSPMESLYTFSSSAEASQTLLDLRAPMYPTQGAPFSQEDMPSDNTVDSNRFPLPKETAHRVFDFMPMLFNLVDTSAPEDLTNIDIDSWNETEQYFNLELERLGHL